MWTGLSTFPPAGLMQDPAGLMHQKCIFSEVASNPTDSNALDNIVRTIEEKSSMEEEINNGLKVQEALKEKEGAFKDTKAKAEADLKALKGALEKQKREWAAAEEKAKLEISTLEAKIEKMSTDHQSDIQETKRGDQYRSEEELELLSKRLENINLSMKRLRDAMKEE